jgi:uncharacterized protein YbaP (TraB family)
MVRSVRRQGFVVFIFFMFIFSVHPPIVFSGDSKSFLWKIRSKTNTIYLLGSIHLFKKELYPLNKNIEEAFEQSAILVVEANVINGRQIDLQQLVDKAIYADDDTLEKHVSRETFDLIKKKAEVLGAPLELINKQKPWFLGLMFSAVEFLKLGLDPNYGIDTHFLSKAAGKKQIVELESVDYQVNLLSRLSDQDQELFLVLSFKDMDTLGRDVDKLLEAWASGNTKEIERLLTRSVTEDSRLSPVYRIIIDDRNTSMALKVEDFLKTKETYFVIVGAGHLVGETGMVEILKKKGYQVDQM